MQQTIVDEAVEAYVLWRESCAAVWLAYSRWATAPADDAKWCHRAYEAALDREGAAAAAYARLVVVLARG